MKKYWLSEKEWAALSTLAELEVDLTIEEQIEPDEQETLNVELAKRSAYWPEIKQFWATRKRIEREMMNEKLHKKKRNRKA